MSKKIVSVILTLMLLISTSAMAAVSVSAAEGEFYEPQPYSPSAEAKEVGLYRYFFLLPNDWKNDYSQSAGIYWWSGTDANGSLDGTSVGVKWPGYKIYQYSTQEVTFYSNNDKESGEALLTGTVWYVDVPSDVPTIIFNNALDGGDKSWDNFDQARNDASRQTANLNVEEIWPEDMDPNYPGLDRILTMNNMIYIIDPTIGGGQSETGQSTFSGNWYFYHGGDMWDSYTNQIYGGPDGPVPGEPEVPTEPQEEPTTAPQTTVQPTTAAGSGETPAPQQGATSNVATNDQATQPTTLAGNGTIATGSLSLAIVVLVIAAAAAGVVIVLRKKEMEK